MSTFYSIKTLLKNCVPPILSKRVVALWGRKEQPMNPELRWIEHKFDGHFDINWGETHFNRIAIINLLCAGQHAEDYLEIGCHDNACFDAVIARNKTGVDPTTGGTHRLTSDAFYADCGDKMFDVVFLDGDHTYEQARRDLLNSLMHVRPGGWVVLHDMFPRNWLEEHVPWIESPIWTGDVWKLGFELTMSSDVEFRILKVDHGVGVLRTTTQDPRIPDMRSTLKAERFKYFYENVSRLPLLDHAAGREWIEDCLRKGVRRRT